MNPLTQIKNTQKATQAEASLRWLLHAATSQKRELQASDSRPV